VRPTSARWPGTHKRREAGASPWWPRAEVQASVQCGGAARWRGGRRGRRRRVVGEVEDAGGVVVLGDGGSGSSHERLRSSRRTALPRTGPISPYPPFTSPSPPAGWWADRGVIPPLPPEAARVGTSSRGSAAAYVGWRGEGTRIQMRCAGGRAARRDGEPCGRRARLCLWASAKGNRLGMTRARHRGGRVTRCAGPACQRPGRTRGRWLRRVACWAGGWA
jgi:hypothetical protein